MQPSPPSPWEMVDVSAQMRPEPAAEDRRGAPACARSSSVSPHALSATRARGAAILAWRVAGLVCDERPRACMAMRGVHAMHAARSLGGQRYFVR